MELISVIVPIYNVENYLRKCIESLIKQTYNNLEIILVDDGSPDNCGIICDEYSKVDKRIKVIHKVNGGLSDARNAGLDLASGEYIVFVDSDDYIDQNMITELYTNLNNTNSDIVICDYVSFDDDYKEYNKYLKNEFVVSNDKFEQLFNEYRLVTTVQWNKLFKRYIFDDLRFPVGKINEDEYVVCSELDKAVRVSYYLKPMYYYLQRSNSITGKINKKRFDSISALNQQIYFFQEKNMNDYVIKSKIHKFSFVALLLCKVHFTDNDIEKELIIKYTKDNKKLGSELIKKYSKYLTLNKKIKILLYLLSPNIYYKLLRKF